MKTPAKTGAYPGGCRRLISKGLPHPQSWIWSGSGDVKNILTGAVVFRALHICSVKILIIIFDHLIMLPNKRALEWCQPVSTCFTQLYLCLAMMHSKWFMSELIRSWSMAISINKRQTTYRIFFLFSTLNRKSKRLVRKPLSAPLQQISRPFSASWADSEQNCAQRNAEQTIVYASERPGEDTANISVSRPISGARGWWSPRTEPSDSFWTMKFSVLLRSMNCATFVKRETLRPNQIRSTEQVTWFMWIMCLKSRHNQFFLMISFKLPRLYTGWAKITWLLFLSLL